MGRVKNDKKIAKNIINGTINATTWTFGALIFLGELSIQAFLKPSYYADMTDSYYTDFFKEQDRKIKKNEYKEMTIRHNLWRLRKQGFVKKKGDMYSLTSKGKALAGYIRNVGKATDESEWDDKYRVVIFDIPEKDRKFRSWLRQELYLLKYKQLQKSVFVSKYPLTPDLVKEIKQKKMGNYINYLLVEKIYKNIV